MIKPLPPLGFRPRKSRLFGQFRRFQRKGLKQWLGALLFIRGGVHVRNASSNHD